MKLKMLREQNKLSQTELSKILDIKRVTYNKYELETNEPNLETLKKIADFYKVSLDYLCDRDNQNQIGYIPADRINLIKYLINAPYNIINQVEIFLKGYNSGKSDQQINFYTPDEI